MARPRKHGEGQSRPVSFRLSESDYLDYQAKCKAAGLTPSEFFNQCVLTNKTVVVAKPRPTADAKRLVFLFNKASNNINQLAHRTNSDHVVGILNDAKYEKILFNLEQIYHFLKIVSRDAH